MDTGVLLEVMRPTCITDDTDGVLNITEIYVRKCTGTKIFVLSERDFINK